MSCVEVTDDDVDHGYPIGVMQAQVKGAVRGEAIACRHGERTGYTLKSVLGMDRVWRGGSGAGGGPMAVQQWQNYPVSLVVITTVSGRNGAGGAPGGASLGTFFYWEGGGTGALGGAP